MSDFGVVINSSIINCQLVWIRSYLDFSLYSSCFMVKMVKNALFSNFLANVAIVEVRDYNWFYVFKFMINLLF